MRHAILVAVLAAAGSVHAAGIGVRAGTTGLGADLGWGMAPTLGARVGLSAMNFNTHVDTSSARYDGKAKLLNLSALLDWSPAGPFRVSGGLVAHANKVDVSAQGGALSGTVKPERSVAPYLGVGYGNVWTRGVNFTFDLGVILQGSPKADLTCAAPVTPAQCANEERRIEDELKKYKYYPVLNLGITVGF